MIYTRVSSDRDGGGRSVGEQEASCRSECERRGWTVEQVLTDNDRSATRWAKKERTEYARLAELLASDHVDVLVTWEASRAQRDLTAYAALRDLCAAHDVNWSYSGRLYDLTDDDDRFATGMDALVAEREAGLTRKRIMRSVEARAATGRAHGLVHDGYRIEYSPETGKPVRRVFDPERAPIIREIAQRLLAGESAYAIAADLNERGVTTSTGKPWRGQNITKRMQSPTIAGLRVHRGEVLDGVAADWPPIISPEDHHRLVALLSDPRRKSNKEGRAVRWLGTGIYECGVCGTPVRMISGYRSSGTRRVRYACPAKHCVMRAAEPTDLVVERTMVAFLSRRDVLRELADETTDAETKAAAAEVARLRAQLQDLRDKVDAGALSLDDYAHFRARWEPQLAAAEERARPKWLPTVVYDIAGPGAAERWKATPITGRRAIVKALVDVRIMPIGQKSNDRTPFDATRIVVRRKGTT